jgi:site-specific recombinase XerD
MTTHNPDNERLKRQYFAFLKHARGQSVASVDACAKALDRFETYNRHRDFKAFHFEQAVGFKRYLAQQPSQRSGRELSKATLHSTLMQLKHFFQWLSGQTGYKSHLKYSDAEYFNLSEKEVRVATAHRRRRAPTLEQVKHVIGKMPATTEIELRNRALIAFALLTGARDSAIASFKLKHLDLTENCVNQDAREVNTKFSKTFPTFFFPVGSEILEIVVKWVGYLRTAKLWGNDDPLFPATQVLVGKTRQFEVAGLDRRHWAGAAPIRAIFREAFESTGLPYFNPHSFRSTIVHLGQEVCKSPEEFKAWSQNLGHERVLTTFLSYGEVECYRQGEIIRTLAKPQGSDRLGAEELADAVFKKLRDWSRNE